MRPFPSRHVAEGKLRETMHPDCIVVGAGINGLLVARELRAAGLRVRVLERGVAGREASWAGGGILSPLHPWRQPDPVTRLAVWSQRRWPGLCEALCVSTGVDPEWTRSGLVVLGTAPKERAQAIAWARRWNVVLQAPAAAGEVRARLGACAAREVAGAGTAGHAIVLPEVAQVRNPRLLRALRAAVAAEGIELFERCTVEAVRVRRGRVVGVEVAGRLMGCEVVVLAAGAWAPGLLPPEIRAPAVEPVRGQMLLWRARPGLLGTILLVGDRYLVPRRDGRILCGSTLERVGFDREPTPEGRRDLEAAARQLCPALKVFPVEAHWAGLRPAAPAGIPYVCAHPEVAGLFLDVGQYRNGVVLAPASARLVADLVLGREPVVPPEPYGFDAPRDPAPGQDLNP